VCAHKPATSSSRRHSAAAAAATMQASGVQQALALAPAPHRRRCSARPLHARGVAPQPCRASAAPAGRRSAARPSCPPAAAPAGGADDEEHAAAAAAAARPLAGARRALAGAAAALMTASSLLSPLSAAALDSKTVGSCVVSQCQSQLARCIGDEKCAENLICLQRCNNTPDEAGCQVRDRAACATALRAMRRCVFSCACAFPWRRTLAASLGLRSRAPRRRAAPAARNSAQLRAALSAAPFSRRARAVEPPARCPARALAASPLTRVVRYPPALPPPLAQIRCGDLYADPVVKDFNTCAVTTKKCVPQRANTGAYPLPPPGSLVTEFNTADFTGRWYISAGLNPLFDIFDCQARGGGGHAGRCCTWRTRVYVRDGVWAEARALTRLRWCGVRRRTFSRRRSRASCSAASTGASAARTVRGAGSALHARRLLFASAAEHVARVCAAPTRARRPVL
jgi:hypothetical protein